MIKASDCSLVRFLGGVFGCLESSKISLLTIFRNRLTLLFKVPGGKVLDLILNLPRSGAGISSRSRQSSGSISSMKSTLTSKRSAGDSESDS